MIHDFDNNRYLTDKQWLTVMSIVSGDKALDLHMPLGENCPVDLTYDGTHYIVHADGTVDQLIQ